MSSLRAAFEDILDITEAADEQVDVNLLNESINEVLEANQEIEESVETAEAFEETVVALESLLSGEHDTQSVMYQHALEAITRRIQLPSDRVVAALESADGKDGLLKRMWDALVAMLKKIKDSIINFFKTFGKGTKALRARADLIKKELDKSVADGKSVAKEGVYTTYANALTIDGMRDVSLARACKDAVNISERSLEETVRFRQMVIGEKISTKMADMVKASSSENAPTGAEIDALLVKCLDEFKIQLNDHQLPGSYGLDIGWTKRITYSRNKANELKGEAKDTINVDDIKSIAGSINDIADVLDEHSKNAERIANETEEGVAVLRKLVSTESKVDSVMIKFAEYRARYVTSGLSAAPSIVANCAKAMTSLAAAAIRNLEAA